LLILVYTPAPGSGSAFPEPLPSKVPCGRPHPMRSGIRSNDSILSYNILTFSSSWNSADKINKVLTDSPGLFPDYLVQGEEKCSENINYLYQTIKDMRKSRK
jgi:hypothetical protein